MKWHTLNWLVMVMVVLNFFIVGTSIAFGMQFVTSDPGSLTPRNVVGDSMAYSISPDLNPNQIVINYITPDNLPNMLFPWLWSAADRPVSWSLAGGAVYDIYDGGELAEIQQATNTWSSIPDCNFGFQQTTFSAPWSGGDGQNGLGWIYSSSLWSSLGLPSNALAVTYSVSNTGDTYDEFDILFNGVYFYWYADSNDPYYGQPAAHDVGHIALHELGHGAGLFDLYNPGSPGHQTWMGTDNESVTMYGYSGSHNDDVSLSMVDMDAMRLAYPVPEPSALALLITGIVACALAVRRKATVR